MENGKQQSYRLLSLSQAIIGGTLFILGAIKYGLNPESLSGLGLEATVAGLGLLVALYYASIHQLIGRKFPTQSALIITTLSTANLLMMIAQTGGLDSPYLSFWLLVVVASGAFGWIFTVITLSSTSLYYAYEAFESGAPIAFMTDHAPALIMTVVAGILAEGVYYRARRTVKQTHQAVESLSGALNQEQGKAQAIVSSMADAVIVVDKDGKINLFNPAAERMTGWDAESALGLDYKAVLGLRNSKDEALTPLTDPLQVAQIKNESCSTSDINLLTRSGRKIALSISVSPVINGNAPTGSVAVFRDITKEKDLERQRDEFISTASHEMRTPVAAIEGYLSLALNPKVATLDDKAKTYLEKAHESTKHLARLFQDLLSATKAENSDFPSSLTAVNITEIIQKTTEDLQYSPLRKELTLEFNVASASSSGAKAIAPLYLVKANPERLSEVITNLVENGFKFTKEGSVTVSIGGDADTVTVSVKDTGMGIAKEDIPHLFQKFYRIDSTDTREIGGTGLGLYICRAIVEAYNGRIWVESELGKGTTFSFSLPRISPEQAQALASAPKAVAPAPSSAPTPSPTPVPTPALAASLPVNPQLASVKAEAPVLTSEANPAQV